MHCKAWSDQLALSDLRLLLVIRRFYWTYNECFVVNRLLEHNGFLRCYCYLITLEEITEDKKRGNTSDQCSAAHVVKFILIVL